MNPRRRVNYLKLTIAFLAAFYVSKICDLLIADSNSGENNSSQYRLIERQIIHPICQCSNRFKEYILVEKHASNTFKFILKHEYWPTIRKNNGKKRSLEMHLFNLSKNELNKYKRTCDLYNVLKRGKNQRIISYSLYGENPKYSQNLEEIAKQLRIKYPKFTSRIYYDSSVPKRTRCRLECLYGDVLDFCNVDQFSTDFNFNAQTRKLTDLSYLHKMMWRFLPLGDSFVDVFMSRDTDSFFIDREIDSVNAWLNSSQVGHIMRDHLYHDYAILGGMWGIKTALDRDLSQRIFSMLMNRSLCESFNRNGESKREGDQDFLREQVYKLLVNNATIHDSYHCRHYADSEPFPTQRIIMDHVGSIFGREKFIPVCPVECRPHDHKDWEYC